jgi:hypothetical protein
VSAVKATRIWTVTFEGTLDDAAREALEAASDVVGPPAAAGPGRNRVRATGATPDEAVRRVRAALDGRGSFGAFAAEPADE